MIEIDEKNTLSSSSFLNQMNCPTSHDSSFIDDRKLPSSTQIYRVNNETHQNQHFNPNIDFHAKSVDFTNNQNKCLFSSSKNLNLNTFTNENSNFKYNENILNKAFIQENIGRNQPNFNYPNNYTIDPYLQNNQFYKFYENQNFRPNQQINYFRQDDEKNLIEQIYMYIRDQNGCRILQKKIEERNPDFLSKFYEKVKKILK